MSSVIDRISAIGIMPVITRIDSPEDCDALAKALSAGGIPAMEITFRMEGADTYIRQARKNHPNVLRESVRFVAEQDSLNASVLGPDVGVPDGNEAGTSSSPALPRHQWP